MSGEQASVGAVVFDMGGVLVRLAPLAEVLRGSGLDGDEAWERWILSEAVAAYESGTCELAEFIDRLIAELGVDLAPDALIDRFRRFPQGLFAGAVELIDELRARNPGCVLGVLSNTNELHWTTQPDHGFLQQAFDRVYLSYQLGMVKPDRAIFDHVVADLGFEPGSVLFLDDNLINVEGARAAGLRSEVARGPAEARDAMVAAGVL